MYNTNPDIKQMKLELDLVNSLRVEKEASMFLAALPGMGEMAGSTVEAGAQILDSIANLTAASIPWAVGGAAGTGLAAAYLAHKIKKINPTDLDVDRSEYYKQTLKNRIAEIRHKQAIEKKQREEQTASEPSLRIT